MLKKGKSHVLHWKATPKHSQSKQKDYQSMISNSNAGVLTLYCDGYLLINHTTNHVSGLPERGEAVRGCSETASRDTTPHRSVARYANKYGSPLCKKSHWKGNLAAKHPKRSLSSPFYLQVELAQLPVGNQFNRKPDMTCALPRRLNINVSRN